jgi:3-oxoacyl-[acyl-carrier-protein] synthase-3
MTPPAQETVPTRPRRQGLTRTCSIAAVGSCLPVRVLSNADLEKMIDTSDEWITTRTGIKERRIAARHEHTSDLAAKAALTAMQRAGVTPEQIDLIVLATITPDMPFPSTACAVQRKIGAARAAAFDIEAACSGFIFALEIGRHFIMAHTVDTALVIGAEKLSSITDWKDRNTCVLFGDGAGAAILRHNPNSRGVLTACIGSDGNKADLISMPGGGSQCPASPHTVAAGMHFLRMNGKETFKSAVNAMCAAATEALRRSETDISQIKCVIPHQANRRIIDAVADRLGATPAQVFTNLEKYGNTSAASVAIALDEAVQSGRVQRGDLILLIAFGAGLTWAAAVIEW